MICSATELFSEESQPERAFSWSCDQFEYVSAGSQVGLCEIDATRSHADNLDDFDAQRKNIQTIQVVEGLLQRMLASASAASARFTSKLTDMANKRKFHTLPDDVLAIILEMACQDSDLVRMANKFSLVSRRFRNIILRLPRLWSKISSPQLHTKTANLFASRATTPSISLYILGTATYLRNRSEEVEHIRVIDMCELAVSISARIQKLCLHLSNSDRPHLQQIIQTFSCVPLPALDELSLKCYTNIGHQNHCKTICRNWDMPSLRKLYVVDVLPELRSDIASRIEFCTVEANRQKSVDELEVEGYWETLEIMGFLLSLTSVKDLHVYVRLVDDYFQIGDGPAMDSVRNLTLGIQNTEVAMGENILRLIQFPAITSFKLDLGLEDIRTLEEALQNIQFVTPPTSVTDLTLAVGIEYESYEGRMPTYMIGEWSALFGGLKTLTLESRRDRSHGLFSFAGQMDAIKVIDREEEGMSGDFLADITHIWNRGPYRTAVLDAEDVGHSSCTVEYIEKR